MPKPLWVNPSSQVGGGGGIPLVAQASASVTTQSADTGTKTVGATRGRRGLTQVQNEIGGSTFCVLVDDFHYIQPNLQIDIGRQIKTASERGIRIIAASVPHRSDDVVRGNSELRGRTLNIDTEFWTDGELEDIARMGFTALNVKIQEPMIKRLAQDACRSPQLMQRICLNVCNSLQISQNAKSQGMSVNRNRPPEHPCHHLYQRGLQDVGANHACWTQDQGTGAESVLFQ